MSVSLDELIESANLAAEKVAALKTKYLETLGGHGPLQEEATRLVAILENLNTQYGTKSTEVAAIIQSIGENARLDAGAAEREGNPPKLADLAQKVEMLKAAILGDGSGAGAGAGLPDPLTPAGAGALLERQEQRQLDRPAGPGQGARRLTPPTGQTASTPAISPVISRSRQGGGFRYSPKKRKRTPASTSSKKKTKSRKTSSSRRRGRSRTHSRARKRRTLTHRRRNSTRIRRSSTYRRRNSIRRRRKH